MTFFDTAEVYGPFANEELLGRALAGRRDRVVLATKFGFKIENGGRSPASTAGPSTSARRSRARCAGSATDHIDLLYQHRVDPAVPIEEVVGAMAALVRGGQGPLPRPLRGGASHDPPRARRAPDRALQSEYSLWERNLERAVIPRLPRARHRLRAVRAARPRLPDRRGQRAEEYPEGDYRRNDPRYQGEQLRRQPARLRGRARGLAAPRAATPAQVALAWLLAQGPDIVPIPGTTRRTRLGENLGALDARLAASDLSELERVFAPGSTSGERYSAAGLAMLDRGPGR